MKALLTHLRLLRWLLELARLDLGGRFVLFNLGQYSRSDVCTKTSGLRGSALASIRGLRDHHLAGMRTRVYVQSLDAVLERARDLLRCCGVHHYIDCRVCALKIEPNPLAPPADFPERVEP